MPRDNFKAKPEKTEYVGTNIPTSVKEALAQEATRNLRSLSAQVAFVLIEWRDGKNTQAAAVLNDQDA